MQDIISTRRIQLSAEPMPPAELHAAIQRDDYERFWRANHTATTTAMQTIAREGEGQAAPRGTCEDCLRGGCCVGTAREDRAPL
jgi:hypothetical protein